MHGSAGALIDAAFGHAIYWSGAIGHAIGHVIRT
jgi:hypothetical protein